VLSKKSGDLTGIELQSRSYAREAKGVTVYRDARGNGRRVNNNKEKEPAQSAAGDCRTVERQFAWSDWRLWVAGTVLEYRLV